MKTLQNLIWNRQRHTQRILHEQMELPLAGSRLTRDEIGFLAEIRRMKEQLGASRRAG